MPANQRISLRDQCDTLGLPFHRIEVSRSAEGWLVEDAFHRPERAAAVMLRAEGWTCATCEGGPMLLLMKAACLERLMELSSLGAADSLTRFLEAQFVINADHLESIFDAISRATTAQVRRNFDAIYAAGVDAYYPGVSGDLIEQLHRALGSRLSSIASRFAGDAYCYRAGWPDITAVRDGTVLFREIKTTDKLHRSQIETIGNVLLPEGLNVDVLQLAAPKAR
jgi:hypothetical protein